MYSLEDEESVREVGLHLCNLHQARETCTQAFDAEHMQDSGMFKNYATLAASTVGKEEIGPPAGALLYKPISCTYRHLALPGSTKLAIQHRRRLGQEIGELAEKVRRSARGGPPPKAKPGRPGSWRLHVALPRLCSSGKVGEQGKA